MQKILYIEDDEIDQLMMKRLCYHFDEVTMDLCSSFRELTKLDLSNYSYILCDSHLTDANYKELSNFLPLHKTQFISGSQMKESNILIKPLSKDQLHTILRVNQVINLQYINDLAEDDAAFKKEMIDTALAILPQRLKELEDARSNLEQLKSMAHKTKSSYRILGIKNDHLSQLESLDEPSFTNQHLIHNLLLLITKQINHALEELKTVRL